MKLLICFLAFTISCALADDMHLHPLSDEFIAHINSLNSTWKAGRNFDASIPTSYIHRLSGTLESDTIGIPKMVHQELDDIPDSFDARENWPKCAKIIGRIKDQGSCGSCWAASTAGAMSDRLCIASKGLKQIYVSDENLVECCRLSCNGCQGGEPLGAWLYWTERGIVSGGDYGTTSGCKAYSIAPCAHHIVSDLPDCIYYGPTPACVKSCDASSSLNYNQELTFGSSFYYMFDDVEQIQKEILTNGPVIGVFHVYTDFWSYKTGVYQKTPAGESTGKIHAVRIIGWGVENNVPYWLIANSWNSEWGDNGFFKFLRGENHLGIEIRISAGLPKLS